MLIELAMGVFAYTSCALGAPGACDPYISIDDTLGTFGLIITAILAAMIPISLIYIKKRYSKIFSTKKLNALRLSIAGIIVLLIASLIATIIAVSWTDPKVDARKAAEYCTNLPSTLAC